MTDPMLPPVVPGAGLSCDEVRDLAAPFVLGALETDEADAVRAHLATCADAHAELTDLAGVLPVLAASVPVVEPPAGLKDRLMAAAAADLAARGGPVGSAGPPMQVSGADRTREPARAPRAPIASPSPRPRPSFAPWTLRIAAVLAIALLGGWNLLLQGQLGDARSYEQSVAAVLDVAGQSGSLTAVLTAEGGGGPAGLAAVGSDGTVALAMRDLAATNGDQVYEAWVIGGDGVPVPLGWFRVGTAGTAYFEGRGLPTEPGIVLALTLEPGPDATTPTMPIVSLGTATAAG